ncbi:hypothetical protein D7W79_11730 [Corallococcus exercitus]|nr:hypothetical protein D7W79_11730 [Corallococcus exercitus]
MSRRAGRPRACVYPRRSPRDAQSFDRVREQAWVSVFRALAAGPRRVRHGGGRAASGPGAAVVRAGCRASGRGRRVPCAGGAPGRHRVDLGLQRLGQLGNGATAGSTLPGQVTGLGSVVAVASSGWHTLALRADGTVWSWGYNGQGQLGDGTTVSRRTPVQVAGLSGVVAVAAGHSHSLALLSDGTVRAWGENTSGQLGDGSTSRSLLPVAVSGLSSAVSLGAGPDFSFAIR